MDHDLTLDVVPDDFPFSDRVALVAGCAGDTGLAIAEGLAKQGATVYLAGGLVVSSEQKWRLSQVEPGLCVVMPALRTSVALSEEFGQYEEHLHILVASAESAPALALAHRDFLLRGSGGAEEPAHVVSLGRSVVSSELAELECEGLVVDAVDPKAVDASDAANMVLFLCDQTSSCDLAVVHKPEGLDERPGFSGIPVLMSKL